MSTFAIVRASVPRSARISREAMRRRLEETCGAILGAQLMPGERNARDALRRAITYRLRPAERQVVNGTEYRVLSAEAKDSKLFRMDFHAQERGKKVLYRHIGAVEFHVNDNTPHWLRGEAVDEFRDVYLALYGPGPGLLNFGQVYLFDSDLRRILEGFLEGKILRLWPGVYVALNESERQAVLETKTLMAGLDEGEITMSLLNLEDTKANREALAAELAQEFTRAFEDIEARAGKPGPNVEGLDAELTALSHRKAHAEALLGVEIPCSESHVNAELAVSDLLTAAEANR